MTVLDWCRHCVNEDAMTLEHLPPKSAGNDQPINLVDEAGSILQQFSEGHAIPTLCDGCNNGASNRGLPGAYKLWRKDVIAAIKATTSASSKGKPFNIWRTLLSVEVAHSYALHPGRVARQVLGMLLAVQSRPQLITDHPQLRDAYFSEDGASIEPFTLHVALANTGFRYFTDVVAAITTNLAQGTSEAIDMHLWCFTPFMATLVDGPAPPWPATRIDRWLGHPTSYHFRKKDREVEYPIADRSHPLIGMMYQGSDL
jgi:hypothetical protein